MKYYLIVGEASGDLHASNLMKALKQHDAEADFRFYGGDKMAAVGGILVKHYKELAYMGFIPVLLHARTILRNMEICKQDIVQWNPDVVILVDYPGFNLKIAKFVHQNTSIPVYYYISPKIWAWKEYRIKNIKRDVDELFSILPFEIDFFEKKHHYPIHYVGNPCVDAIQEAPSTPPKGGAPIPQSIAILAGSRKQEIKDNLSMMLHAASQFPEYQLVLAGAPNIPLEFYQKYIPKDIQVDIQFGKTYEILRQSAAALVTSGTATLETAILRIPQVVCYYTPMGRFISFLRSKLLKVKYISLVNLIVNREIVRELVADTMKEENIVKELRNILPGGTKRQQMLTDYEEMNRILGPAGASERAGKTIVELLRNKVKMKNEKMKK
ncbi:MAG: lipid-A-disaccharide synthase [Bacteroidaceae bacterium]|nr:lipid-A-disaccharide synthase [Bacteroidaceae bacterium]